MTADEARQLQGLANNVGELTVAVVDTRVAVARLEERVATLFHAEATRLVACHDRHEKLDVRIDAYDNRQRGLLGMQSKLAGAATLAGLIATGIGAVAAFGRILGAW